MSARRFFIEGAHTSGERVCVGDDDAHKILHVLRLRAGDELEVIDSAGNIYSAPIVEANERVTVLLDKRIEHARENATMQIDVAQGVPKGQKMDFIVEKLTELGVNRILPFTSERTVVREAGDGKIGRWRRLAQSAAQQSGRTSIPDVAEPIAFQAVLDRCRDYDLVLFPWEVAAGAPLRETLPALVTGSRRVLAIIGPEGGFSHDEAQRAREAGARVISLGARILRTETAGLVLVSILQYLSA